MMVVEGWTCYTKHNTCFKTLQAQYIQEDYMQIYGHDMDTVISTGNNCIAEILNL